MSAPIPVVIGPHSFKSKSALLKFVQSILYRHERRTPIEGEDKAFVRELFKFNPLYEEKMANRGIDHFYVATNRHGTHSFYIVFDDKAEDDFSFRKAIRAIYASPSKS